MGFESTSETGNHAKPLGSAEGKHDKKPMAREEAVELVTDSQRKGSEISTAPGLSLDDGTVIQRCPGHGSEEIVDLRGRAAKFSPALGLRPHYGFKGS